MKARSLVLLFVSCLKCAGQYTTTHYVDFEGGTNGTLVGTNALNASLHGVAVNSWSPLFTHSLLTFTNFAQKDLYGTITVTNGSFGPSGSLGMAASLDSWGDSFSVIPTASGGTSLSAGVWFLTDLANSQPLNCDWFTVFGSSGGYVNPILNRSGVGGQLRVVLELASPLPSIGGQVNLTNNTWYWITVGYNVGGTNGQFIELFDASEHSLGRLGTNLAQRSENAYRAGLGITSQSGGAATNYHIYTDGLMVNTNGDFPLLPGSTATQTTITGSLTISGSVTIK